MDDNARRKILDEARANVDVLAKWRQQAEQFAAEAEQGREEIREEERRMRETPQAWENWYLAMLQRHLMDHVQPHLDGLVQGACELIGEQARKITACEQRLEQQRNEIQALQLECARLAIKIAEVQTDKVLAAMPGSSTLRSAVN
jgi:hypothetical protein